MEIEYFHGADYENGAIARKRRSSVRRAGFRVALISATMFAFGLIVPPSGGATPSSGPLSTHTCTVDNMAARCGTLMVPQDRITRTSPEIPIRVVVVPATSPVRQPDPIVFFAGGPGSSAIDMMSEELPLFPLNTSRDLVFIDQRGTGASNLTCPSFPSLADEAALQTSVESCLQHLKADLRFYTTAMFADDVDEVLSDLHYGKVDLVGASYGATSEQMFLMRHPKRVRTMTLISGTLLGIPILERFPLNAQRALDNVFAECAVRSRAIGLSPVSARTGTPCGPRLTRRPGSSRPSSRRPASRKSSTPTRLPRRCTRSSWTPRPRPSSP